MADTPTQQAPGNYYPPLEDVELVCEFLDRGYSHEQAALMLFDDLRPYYHGRPSDLRAKCRRLVATVSGDRVRWNPQKSQVTMDLAFEGDYDAWLSLTYYERKEVIDRLCLVYKGRIPHPSWPDFTPEEGIYHWAERVHERGERITNLFHKNREKFDG